MRADAAPSLVLSHQPVPSFPRSCRLLLPGRDVAVGDHLRVRLVSTFNVQPESVLSGLQISWRLLRWCRAQPRGTERVAISVNLADPPGIFPWLACRLGRAKLVGWILDLFEPGSLVPANWRRRMSFAVERWLLRRLDGRVVAADRIVEDWAPGLPYLRIASMSSGQRRGVGERARAFALTEESWDAQVARLLSYLRDEVVGAERSPTGPGSPA